MCAENDFEAYRQQQAWTHWNYTMQGTGCKMPTHTPNPGPTASAAPRSGWKRPISTSSQCTLFPSALVPEIGYSSLTTQEFGMDTPIERVMRAYEMMNNLTTEQEEDARARVEKFLRDHTGTAEELAVLGVQYLRGNCSVKARRKRQPA
jgi:hypothetical protein